MEDTQILDDFDFDSQQDIYQDSKTVELISLNKFLFFYLITVGLYGLWWMYKSWKFFKEKDQLDIMPVGRTIFAIFYAHTLFETILDYAKSNGYQKTYSSVGLFVMMILLNLAAKLPDPYSMIAILGFLPLIQPFQALNYAITNAEDYYAVQRRGLNARQVFLIIFGILLWVLAIIGMIVPPQ